MLKRVLAVAAVMVMIAMLIGDPLTTLATQICFNDEGQTRHPQRWHLITDHCPLVKHSLFNGCKFNRFHLQIISPPARIIRQKEQLTTARRQHPVPRLPARPAPPVPSVSAAITLTVNER